MSVVRLPLGSVEVLLKVEVDSLSVEVVWCSVVDEDEELEELVAVVKVEEVEGAEELVAELEVVEGAEVEVDSEVVAGGVVV